MAACDKSALMATTGRLALSLAAIAWFVAAGSPALAQTAQEAPAQTPDQAPNDGPIAEEDRLILDADDIIRDDSNNQIIAQGNVEGRFRDRILRADRAVFDRTSGRVRASGNVQVIEANGDVRYADEIDVAEALDIGFATNVFTRIGRQAIAAAATAERAPDGVNIYGQATYTACSFLCADGTRRQPTWVLRSRRAVQDTENGIITHRDAVLAVKGIPIFYAPFFAHPDPEATRRSGLLAPGFGQDRRLGFIYEQPYFWAISPSQDLTLTAQIHTNIRPLLRARYRQKFFSGDVFIEASGTREAQFDNDGFRIDVDGDGLIEREFQGHVFSSGLFDINETFRWGFAGNRSSDDLFLRRYDLPTDGLASAAFFTQPLVLQSNAFFEGQTENFYLRAYTAVFQGQRGFDIQDDTPRVLPAVEAGFRFVDPAFGGDVDLGLSGLILDRDAGPDSRRGSLTGRWTRDLVLGPGIVVEPRLELRGDLFNFDESEIDASEGVFTRGAFLAGGEIRWPLHRPGNRVDLFVEPVFAIGYGEASQDNARIINEDSQAFDVDVSSIFRLNGAPNNDLFEEGLRWIAGARGRVSWAGGSWDVEIGRRWNDDPDPVFDLLSNLSERGSDIVVGSQLRAGERFTQVVRLRVDDDNLAVRRADVTTQIKFWRLTGTANYSRTAPDFAFGAFEADSEASFNTGVQLTRNWSLDGGATFDIDAGEPRGWGVGVTYRDDCTFVRLGVRRTNVEDREFGQGLVFRFEIGLATIGILGAR